MGNIKLQIIKDIIPQVDFLRGGKILSPVNPSGYYVIDSNTLILKDSDGSIDVIDPGFYRYDDEYFEKKLNFLNSLNIRNIFLTHRHFDHFAIMNVMNFSGEVFAHPITDEEVQYHPGFATGHINFYDLLKTYFGINPELLRHYQAKSIIDKSVKIGPYKFEIIHSPGHSPDLLVFYQKENRFIATGDLIVTVKKNKLIVRAGTLRPQGSNCYDLIRSLNKLLQLDLDILIPGHGEPLLVKKDIEEMKKNIPYMFYKVVEEYINSKKPGERFGKK